jgi:signal transduction histidine kinase
VGHNGCMKARRLAWAAAALGALMAVAALILELSSGTLQSDPGMLLAGLFVGLLVAVGLVLVVRAGALVVGWLLLGLGTYLMLVGLANDITTELAERQGTESTALRFVLALGSASWVAVLGAVATIAFVFPDGRTMSRRWGIALRVSFCAYALTTLGIVLSRKPNVEPPFEDVPGPFSLPSWFYGTMFVVGWPLTLASLLVAALAVIVRYRRSTGIERLQLRWFAWSILVVPATLLAVAFTWLVFGEVNGPLVGAFFFASIALPTVVIGLAVTRYRLYSIDLVINRTLVYGTLTVLLGLAWVALSLTIGVALGRGSTWAAAGATLAVAVAFGPLRRRIQDHVDRRFARARHEAVARIRAFEEDVREGVAEPEALDEILRVALAEPAADVLFRLPEGDGYVDRYAQPRLAVEETGSRVETPIRHRGQEVAVLVHDASLLERRELLRSVVDAASLTAEIARLRIGLRLQLAEVERSRTRLVRAGYEERRRIERDLHDGAQQRLVSLGIRLRRMQRALPAEARVLQPALDGAVDEVAQAIEGLRTLAAGVRPASLDEGLGAALTDLARTVPVPIEVEVADERLPPTVEEAAYFVACEALTNAVKHASASRVQVAAGRIDGVLQLVVADDGVGGAIPGRGSGLVGLADRVEAQGGRLRVESPLGGGTRIEAVIPCGS